jgi:hypothetical protein
MKLKSFSDAAAVAVLGAIGLLLWVFYDIYQWLWSGL